MNKYKYKMTRTFNPIGQGAFYTEKFEDNDFVMVYDCGSNTGGVSLDEIMDNQLPNKKIDLLVISHFHADHISGLEYLLTTYDVKKIMLPLLHPVDKIDVYLYNVQSNASSFIQKLCLDPEKTIRDASQMYDTSIIYVSSEIGNNKIIKIEELSRSKTIKSGDIILYTHPNLIHDWHYVPFNFDYIKRSKQLIRLFKKEGIPFDVDGFIKLYKLNKKKVIDVYGQIKGDMNTNSLVVYSGVSNHIKTVKCTGYYSRGFKAEKFYMRHNKVGCLYLGDYNARGQQKWLAFQKAYDVYFKYISIIQIPHHGSKDNYNVGLNFLNNILSIISVGKQNKYDHPDDEVVKKIILNNGIPILVTEEEPSKFIQKVSLYL